MVVLMVGSKVARWALTTVVKWGDVMVDSLVLQMEIVKVAHLVILKVVLTVDNLAAMTVDE